MAPKKNAAAASAADTAATTPATSAAPPAPAAAAAVDDGAVTSAAAATATATSLSERINALAAAAASAANSMREIVATIKVVQKDVARLEKDAAKPRGRRAAGSAAAKAAAPGGEGAERKASGFTKPTQLSAELCDFLGLPHESRMPRTECTRLLNKYIKDNNLQDKEDKRTIQPDGKLQKVLKRENDEKVTYFNLQKLIKHHFVKDAAAAPTATA